MDIVVRVRKVLPSSSFFKRDGGEVVVNGFVGVLEGGQFERVMKFDVLGSDRWNQMRIVEGGLYEIQFDANSRESNGKWYTSLNCWYAKAVSSENGSGDSGTQTSASGSGGDDEPPF